MKFKVGFVGCGRIAGIQDKPRDSGYVGTHALAYYQHPSFEMKSVFCPNRYKIFQKIWSVPNGYDNLDEFLKKEKLDVISLSSPNEYHYPQIKQILESDNPPKAIFAEKPICLNPSELKSLKDLADKKKCKIIVNHTRRFDPGHIKVKELIKSKKLGKFLGGRYDYYGGWLHNGCHLIDTLRMLFGEEPEIKSVKPGPPGKNDDPCLNVKLKIAGGDIDVVGFDKKYYYIYDGEFRFENGRILLQDFGKKITVEKVEVNKLNERMLVPFSDSPWKGLDSPISHSVDLISGYLKGKESLSDYGVSLDEATGTMNVLWKAREMYDKTKNKEKKV